MIKTLSDTIPRGLSSLSSFLNYQALLDSSCQLYVDLFGSDQKGFGLITNGTGVSDTTYLVAGDNTVTVSTEGTFVIWLPNNHTGTAASGTATVSGSPVSLVAGNNTITVSGTGTITVTCPDQITDRSANAVLCTATGTTWGSDGRTFASGNYISAPATALNFTTQDFGIFMWVYPTTLLGATRLLAGRGLLNTDGWWIHTSAAGSLTVVTNQAAANQQSYSDAGQLIINQWQFIGATRSGAVGKVWKNAVDITTTSASHINPATSSRNFLLGIFDDLASYPYIGKMDNIFVYNRLPTQAEILSIYNRTRGRYGV